VGFRPHPTTTTNKTKDERYAGIIYADQRATGDDMTARVFGAVFYGICAIAGIAIAGVFIDSLPSETAFDWSVIVPGGIWATLGYYAGSRVTT
jgi:hypothetical protein